MSDTKKEDIDTKLEKDAIMDEPDILPHDAKFMTPLRTLLHGNPIPSDPQLFQIQLKKWGDFLRFLEPVRRNIVGGKAPTPTLPVFYNINELSDEAIISFMGLGGFRKKSIISYSFTEKIKDKMDGFSMKSKNWIKKDKLKEKIKALEDKGYIVVPGDLDPYF